MFLFCSFGVLKKFFKKKYLASKSDAVLFQGWFLPIYFLPLNGVLLFSRFFACLVILLTLLKIGHLKEPISPSLYRWVLHSSIPSLVIWLFSSPWDQLKVKAQGESSRSSHVSSEYVSSLSLWGFTNSPVYMANFECLNFAESHPAFWGSRWSIVYLHL